MGENQGAQPCTGGAEVRAGEALGPGALSAWTRSVEAHRWHSGAPSAGGVGQAMSRDGAAMEVTRKSELFASVSEAVTQR